MHEEGGYASFKKKRAKSRDGVPQVVPLLLRDGNSRFAEASNTAKGGSGPVEEEEDEREDDREDGLVERKLGLVERRVRSRGSGRVYGGAER